MNHLKTAIIGGAAVLILTTAALAAPACGTPAEAAAGVTGKTLEEVLAERLSGKCYGAIAAEAGALEDFQAAVLELREAALADGVANGILTQDQADARLAALAQRQEACGGNGTGCCGLGSGQNAGYGYGRGCGRGYGRGVDQTWRRGLCRQNP